MSEERVPYARRVADKIIAQLEAGVAPWQKPWDPSMPDGSRPFNPVTGNFYHGGNFIALSCQGRDDPRWMTFNHVQQLGARVRPGEKSSLCMRWIYDEEVWNEEKKAKETVRLARPKCVPFCVFNAEQLSGLPAYVKPEVTWEPCTRADDLIKSYGVPIEHRAGDQAFYSHAADRIVLPMPQQFKSLEHYYSVAMHEVIHSTGHASRLARDMSGSFGTERYSREELRAEIGAWMGCAHLGLATEGVDQNHVSYVQSWLKVLRDDPEEIFRAAADAQKAVDLVMTHDHVLFKDAQKEARKLEIKEPVQQREPQRSRHRERTREPAQAGATR
ncbi:MAG: zincin-like metallopeptidase domain-containing protein [Rhodanobacter sp.]